MNLKSLLLENKSVKQAIFKNTFWFFATEGISKGLTIYIAKKDTLTSKTRAKQLSLPAPDKAKN